MNADTAIAEMKDYMMNVLEKSHPTFGNLPICPFAKKFRVENKIEFQVYPFAEADLDRESDLLKLIDAFHQNPQFEVLLVIHPQVSAMTPITLEHWTQQLCQIIQPLNLIAYGGHPKDSFNIDGLYTRREPYMNFTVQTKGKLKWASDLLQHTGYYQNWSPENLNAVGMPRV
jgi:hypothetical protein